MLSPCSIDADSLAINLAGSVFFIRRLSPYCTSLFPAPALQRSCILRPTSLSRPYARMASSKSSYPREQAVAVAAVLKACQVAQATFQKLVNDETVTKKDKSPVTGTPALRPAEELLLKDIVPQSRTMPLKRSSRPSLPSTFLTSL